MKKKRGRIIGNSSRRKRKVISLQRAHNRYHHRYVHRHHSHPHRPALSVRSLSVLSILLTLAVAAFVVAILAIIQMPPLYLNLFLMAFLILVLAEMVFYLHQKHRFHHTHLFASRHRVIFHPRAHSRRRFRTSKIKLPKMVFPKITLPKINLMERVHSILNRLKQGLKRSHHQQNKVSAVSSHQVLHRFFNVRKHPVSRPISKTEVQHPVIAPTVDRTKIQKKLNLKAYETEIDAMYGLVQERGKISIDDVSIKFNVSKELVQEWARILEEHHLIQIHYPPLGSPELRPYEPEDNAEENSP